MVVREKAFWLLCILVSVVAKWVVIMFCGVNENIFGSQSLWVMDQVWPNWCLRLGLSSSPSQGLNWGESVASSLTLSWSLCEKPVSSGADHTATCFYTMALKAQIVFARPKSSRQTNPWVVSEVSECNGRHRLHPVSWLCSLQDDVGFPDALLR